MDGKQKVHKKGRGPKPKMTKEQRREKYTAIARNQRNKHMTRARDKNLVCFRCRQKGHAAENCTNVPAKRDDSKKKQSNNICYKCGSTEHRIQQCPKVKGLIKTGQRFDFGKLGDLPFANCYVCNKKGHLAGNCPDSEKGLYPNGGSCRLCGKVDHYAHDCPTKQAKKEQFSDEESVTIEQYLDEPSKDDKIEKKVQKPKRKVVNF